VSAALNSEKAKAHHGRGGEVGQGRGTEKPGKLMKKGKEKVSERGEGKRMGGGFSLHKTKGWPRGIRESLYGERNLIR